MKTRIFGFLSLFILPLAISAQVALPTEAEVFFQKAMTQINPKHVAWIKGTVIDVNSKKLDENAVNDLSKSYGQVSDLGNMDIMALGFLVIMQASKNASNDLKEIEEAVKAINKQKDTMRDAVQLLKEQQAGKKEISRYQYDFLKDLKTDLLTLQKTDTSKKINNKAVVTAEEIDQLKYDLKDKLDTLGSISEKLTLQIQMYQDRYNRFINWLLSFMKKISDTQDSIINNLK